MKSIAYVSGDKYRHLVEECIQLDNAVYESKYVGSSEFYNHVYNTDSRNFIFAIDTDNGTLAGYMLNIPLTDKAYNAMKTGELIDTEFIETKDITNLSEKEFNNIYIYSLVVNPIYQGMGISKKMTDTFLDNINKLNKSNIKIGSILGDTINPKAFCNMLRYGFAPIGNTSHESVLIEKSFDWESKIIPKSMPGKIIV